MNKETKNNKGSVIKTSPINHRQPLLRLSQKIQESKEFDSGAKGHILLVLKQLRANLTDDLRQHLLTRKIVFSYGQCDLIETKLLGGKVDSKEAESLVNRYQKWSAILDKSLRMANIPGVKGKKGKVSRIFHFF